MIGRDDFGRMIAIFALSYTDPLFETSYLTIEDKDIFRESCRLSIHETADAYYHQSVMAWVVDWSGLAERFTASYTNTAAEADLEKLLWWLQHGYNGIYAPDLLSNMWDGCLHWAKHHDTWAQGVEAAVIERTRSMLRSVSSERRSEQHMGVIVTIRDHQDTDVDMFIKSKLHLDFYDGFVDPLLIFTCMRGKFVLMDKVRANADDKELIAALNRIPVAWYEDEGKNYKDLDYRKLMHSRIEDMLDA